MKKIITNNLINIPGQRLNKKILVIESDDWGSIRIPSLEVFDKLKSKGIKVDSSPYCRYDSLATAEDLQNLFEVLTSVKDSKGNYAKITADCVVANPDFKKIKDSNFNEYYYEPFTTTLEKTQGKENAFALWKQGINENIFVPQFHGREHLNVKKWMESLRNNDVKTHLAFKYNCWGIPNTCVNYMGAFDSGMQDDILHYSSIIEDGLNLFESLFGFKSTTFIPTRYTWHPDIEKGLIEKGVFALQGMVSQKIPLDSEESFKYKNNNFFGHRSQNKLKYLMRNCYFEPSQNQGFDWLGNCLQRINIAFRWHKPATISMHRLNMIGALDIKNRDANLNLLSILLKTVVKKWPDVQFMTSNELEKNIK